ncbi:hypothetical protein [Pedosphaera parvula]|nr:hypothetical protein [Pedosphaera parvula]
MRATIVVLLGVLLCSLSVWAEEKLAVLKVGSEVYSNVTVTSVTTTDIYFSHGQGMGNAKLKRLEPEMQKHFHYDAAKASATEQQQKDANARYVPPSANTSRPTPAPEEEDPKAVMEEAIAKVKAIVNQPVTQVSRKSGMNVSIYKPGWFHDGAIKPDFDTVDVRATQEFIYDKHPYVSTDQNPGVAFNGPELEFNAMTKYFYVDRSLPKKKLTEAEMLEINRLYRIIGSCEKKLK